MSKKRPKIRSKSKKRDPLYVDGERPRPLYVDYKNVDFLGQFVNRQGSMIGRRKTGCTPVSQNAISQAIKRARFMALLPFVSSDDSGTGKSKSW